LCMMKPDPDTNEFEVVSLHPGVTREIVRERTGWTARFAPSVAETPPPDTGELETLRDLQARTARAHKRHSCASLARTNPAASRPAPVLLSRLRHSSGARLVTQMSFPVHPLSPYGPILHSIPDPLAQARLVSRFDLALTDPEWALGYRWDIVLRGRHSTPFEE